MALDNVTSHFSTMLEPITSASFLSSLSIIHATMQFMDHFYEHLVCGESASESLHQAMKWMRENRFSDVEQWAPFILMGDDVTFKG